MTLQEEIIQQVQQIDDPNALEAILSYAKSFGDEQAPSDLSAAQHQLINQRLKAYKEDPDGNMDAFLRLKQHKQARGWNI